MPTPQDNLGGRLPLIDPGELAGGARKVYDLIDARYVPWAEKAGFRSKDAAGRLIGPFNAFLRSPEITAALLEWESVEQAHTTLTERERQVVILAVGAAWGSDYERYAHAAVAREAGLPEPAIRALRAGDDAPGLGDRERIAQAFTRQFAAEHRVGGELYREAEAAFGPRGIVEIVYLAGHYMTISSLLNVFEVPVPEEPPGAEEAP